MAHQVLVSATDLDSWSRLLEAQSLLPELVSRLVQATGVQLSRVEFRSGEGVQQAGWDGLVVADGASPFVPDAISGWELSVYSNLQRKASKDYDERTERPIGLDPARTAFVFVTSRRWPGKAKWVTEREREGRWREVRALDADDLFAWLQAAPAVHYWISKRLGKYPVGAVDLESYWLDWSEATQPPLPATLLLAGRNEVLIRIHGWLKDSDSPTLSLRAESREEAMVASIAAILLLPDEHREAILARALVVKDLSAWNHLVAGPVQLILFGNAIDPASMTRATRSGHKVVIPLGQSDAPLTETIQLPRLDLSEAEDSLKSLGQDAARARELAEVARRSLKALWRRLASSPALEQPAWALPANARPLIPALLVGAWNDSNQADRQIIEILAGKPYAQFTDDLVRWAHEDDPPIRQIGDVWLITSREDAWSLLSRYITRTDLGRFERALFMVLDVADPRFDLPANERHLAQIRGQVHANSSVIRSGLNECLAALGTHDGLLASAGSAPSHLIAGDIIRRLLEHANNDWRLWASLSLGLPLMAEAAPDEFLNAVEEGLKGDEPLMRSLFQDTESYPFGDSPHTGLLWALERLAWSPDYLARASILLARLAAIDPGGTLSNRPDRSLRQIYLLWYPQTAADPDRRLDIIDMLRQQQPEQAWDLLIGLIPDLGMTAITGTTPSWRDWAVGQPRIVTVAEFHTGVRGVFSRLLSDVGMDAHRWKALLCRYRDLDPELREQLLEHLTSLDTLELSSDGSAAIWHGLRKAISHYRSFHSDDEAQLNEAARLESIRARFEPANPIDQFGWLFSSQPELLSGLQKELQLLEAELQSARSDAVRSVYLDVGFHGLIEMANIIESPYSLGRSIGEGDLLEEREDHLVLSHLGSEQANRDQLAFGYAMGRIATRGRQWVELQLEASGSIIVPKNRARMLLCLPCGEDTWELVANYGGDTEDEYWRMVHPWSVPSKTNVDVAAQKLIEHRRPRAAVHLLASRQYNGEAGALNLMVAALERSLEVPLQDDPPDQHHHLWVRKLLEILANSGDVDVHRLLLLEWAYLPYVLEKDFSPTTLHRALSESPQLFVEILGLMFRSHDDSDAPPSQQNEELARRSFQLLQSWRTIPGLALDGSINQSALANWVSSARDCLQESEHRELGDELIGQMLSGAPATEDHVWPHSCVCKLIEDLASDNLERGIEIGKINERGATWRRSTEGGVQERDLAAAFDSDARAVSGRWPRTGAMLRRLASNYRQSGRREDEDAELRQDLR